jgi:hypothetical protein
MKYLLIFLLPLTLWANEKAFVDMANKKCGKIKVEKEKQACITGTFLEFCQKPENQSFCKMEAMRSDYGKRMEGAKIGLKKIYRYIKKTEKKYGKPQLDLSEVFVEGKNETYYYIFGVPEKCTEVLKKDSPTNSSTLHSIYERTNIAGKAILKTLNKFPCPRKGDFKVYAIGQIDEDMTFDIWYVDSGKRIKHFRSDYKR